MNKMLIRQHKLNYLLIAILLYQKNLLKYYLRISFNNSSAFVF